MSRGPGLDRASLVSCLAEHACALQWPMIVGSGFLARQAMGVRLDGLRLLPLQGGMGLASGVGAGIALATGAPVLVLEGDGNHLMGWAGAQLIGHLEVPVLHVVSWNGMYRSTGGQPLPSRIGPTSSPLVAGLLGYQSGKTVEDLPTLMHELAAFDGAPRLLYVAEAPETSPPPRKDAPSSLYSRQLREALASEEGACTT